MKKRRMPDLEIDQLILHLLAIWRREQRLPGPPDRLQTREFRGVVERVIQIQSGYLQQKASERTAYFSDQALLGAYLLYNWVVHYQEGMHLINELPSPPRRVLDLGSGPAPFAFAALRHGASETIAIDHSSDALRIAGEVCGRYGYPLSVRLHSLHRWPFPVDGKFDLIVLGYVLEELFPESKEHWEEVQWAWVEKVASLLTPDGVLLVVESSQPGSNRRFLRLRDRLVKAGYPMQAPCVWRGECPALAAGELCYAQREFEKPYLIREIQRAAGIHLSSLKMSAMHARARGASWPGLPGEEPYYRVISPSIEGRLGKRYYLCGTDGKKELCAPQGVSQDARAFDYLKRGELVVCHNCDRVGTDRIVVRQGSSLDVAAPLSKPLPRE